MQAHRNRGTLLSINNYYYRRGGAEVVFLEQNRLFDEIGWNVVPFAMRHPKNMVSEWDRFFVDEIEFGQEYSAVKKMMMAPKVIFSMESRRKIGALVDTVKPGVAHAHNVYHHISPSIFTALKSRGVPTVLTLHDLKIACPAYKMLTHDGVCERCNGGRIWNVVQHRCVKNSTALSALVFLEAAANRLLGSYTRGVDRFIVPSRFFMEKFVEWGFSRDRFTYVPNFVNVEQLAPRGSPGEHFVYFGRLAADKGIETFIRALGIAKVPGKIVGTGDEEDNLRRVAEEVGADVSFLGYRTGEDLFDAIRASRAVVLPSELYENAPMSIMESYSLERPVIGSAIGGIPELVRPGVTGELFESGNAEDLAAKISGMAAKSASDILEMGRAGRAWMAADFTDVKYRERLLSLYGDLGVAS